ncbi:P27 family predicted phage terminase small subunit [Pontibacter ummariensis]|uniref:Phage terminase, small subunit, putative, P27 family n=1 Tax=Pontibacter ummariensis TaxID=1610492 RepID=A0A239HKL0_9BACT|nr:phage terminase small subunit P27 family [Pontibacter ummariensis]PRY10295.1 P27 family predicted phage terminase small subunit [Pontibacter ummariensis]SNS81618.1 phage terminase, small subunit, putative, P27 family [Pontibacter ummariensis]
MANPRKSDEDKNIQGTARRDRSAPESVSPNLVTKLPKAPSILGKIGKGLWKKYTKILHEQGVLATTDLDMLAQYCMQLQIAEQAAIELNNGLVETLNNGKQKMEVKSKYLSIFNDASDRAAKLAKEFGFTLLSRKNIPAPPKKKEGRLVALMGGK